MFDLMPTATTRELGGRGQAAGNVARRRRRLHRDAAQGHGRRHPARPPPGGRGRGAGAQAAPTRSASSSTCTGGAKLDGDAELPDALEGRPEEGAPRRQRMRHARLAEFLRDRARPRSDRAGRRRTRALRAAFPLVPRGRRSTSTRPTTGDARSSSGWSTSRPRSRTRSRPGASVDEAIEVLEKDQSRKLNGTDALRSGCRSSSDKARRRAVARPLRHPRPGEDPRVHDRSHQGGRHLLHGPERRLLAPRPDVVERSPRVSPSSTPGARSPRCTTRVRRAITSRSARPSTTARR